MHVIRHDNPCPQFVTRAVKHAQSILNELRYRRLAQVTFATSAVQIRFQLNAPLTVLLDAPEVLPLAAQCLGKRIRQMECDELGEARFISVRKVAALMPAAETAHGVLALRRRGMTSHVGDQLAHGGIVRWSGTTMFGW